MVYKRKKLNDWFTDTTHLKLVMKSSIWFQTNLHSTQVNYHDYKLSTFIDIYQLDKKPEHSTNLVVPVNQPLCVFFLHLLWKEK